MRLSKAPPSTAPQKGKAIFHWVSLAGKKCLVKDYSHSSKIFRYTCGLYMAHREAQAYRRLKEIESVPELLGRRWPDGIVIEWIEGTNCLGQKNLIVPTEFFDHLRFILKTIRDRKVLHGDVRRNVLIDPKGKPFIVDFGASFVISWWLRPIEKIILTLGARYDERAVLKLKRQISPGNLTVEEEAAVAGELPIEHLVKIVERLIRKTTLWIVNLEMRRGS
jgi:hypothetical protein